MKKISSKKNPLIKRIRSIQSKSKIRSDENLFAVEGIRLVTEAMDSGWEIEQILYFEGLSERGEAIVQSCLSRKIPMIEVSPEVMDYISDTETPQGLMALVNRENTPLNPEIDLIIIADQIRDPGNLGVILRTLSAVGNSGMVIVPGTVDPFSPKVLRAGMGAHFKVPIKRMSWEEIGRTLREMNYRISLASSADGREYTEVNYGERSALIIGGEAQGSGKEAAELADQIVSIPMPGGIESLNASVSAGILIYEILRRRRKEP